MTAETRAALTTEINSNLPDNTSGLITPALLRQVVQDLNDSNFNPLSDSFNGDFTTSGLTGVFKAVNAAIGTFGDAAHVVQLILNAKGQVTGASLVAITPSAIAAVPITTTVAGHPLSSNVAIAASDLTDGTNGTGAIVLSNSPALVTPALGTPASGVATNLTGTAAGLTAGHVTTNANLTGPITSVGNATAIASQTGTGTKIVVDNAPTLQNPIVGTQAITDNSTKAASTAFAFNVLASVDVRTYGATPDCRRLTDITATSGSASISSGGLAAFTPSDTGKIINLYDFTNNNYIFRGTFTYVSSTTGTLSGNAGSSLSAANCIGYIGTDNSTAIIAALAAAAVNLSPVSQGVNLALGGGNQTIVFPTSSVGNMYAFASQLIIPTNVTIDADAMLVPMVGTASTNGQGQGNRIWPLVLQPGANIDYLQMFCNYTQGILLGSFNQQSHSHINGLTLWDGGANNPGGVGAVSAYVQAAGAGYVVGEKITLTGGTASVQAIFQVTQIGASGAVVNAVCVNGGNYTVLPSNPVSQGSSTGAGTGCTLNVNYVSNSQSALTMSGNDYFINHFWCKNFSVGLNMVNCGDVLINSVELIGDAVGCQMSFCEAVFIGNFQADTNSFAACLIDASHMVRIANGNYFSINATAATYGLGVGQVSTTLCSDLDICFSGLRGGGDGLRLGACQDSRFRLNFTNASQFSGSGSVIANGVNFTGAAACAGNILVDLALGTIGTAIAAKTGTGYGQFLLNGAPLYSVQAPATGFTITIDSATPVLALNPAGTLATGTINMPANPMDGMEAVISSSQIITALTHNGNGNTLKNALTTLAAGGAGKWKYQLSSTTWFRIQ